MKGTKTADEGTYSCAFDVSDDMPLILDKIVVYVYTNEIYGMVTEKI
jgi:hypothetical protein